MGPVKDPVSGSNSQPLFATAHPRSGASFSCTVVAQNQGHESFFAVGNRQSGSADSAHVREYRGVFYRQHQLRRAGIGRTRNIVKLLKRLAFCLTDKKKN
ncbi:MAG: hypothetical protein WBN03_20315 [Desulfobacterales bacterium]